MTTKMFAWRSKVNERTKDDSVVSSSRSTKPYAFEHSSRKKGAMDVLSKTDTNTVLCVVVAIGCFLCAKWYRNDKNKNDNDKAKKNKNDNKSSSSSSNKRAFSVPNRPTVQSSSIPRNKRQTNKKSKRIRERQSKNRKENEEELKKDLERAKKSIAQKGNQVPKDTEMIGGEAGKTFTTTSHVKVPVWYAEDRKRRGRAE